jgi:hypothetical protein
MSQRRIHVDDAHIQQVQSAIVALKSDVDRERAWLSSATEPIQPPDQVWPLAAALVSAWGNWRQSLQRWNDAIAADLEGVGAGIETARGLHGLGEDLASDLARKGIS